MTQYRTDIRQITRKQRRRVRRHPKQYLLRKLIQGYQRDRLTLQAMAARLNAAGYSTVTGKQWTCGTLANYIRREGLNEGQEVHEQRVRRARRRAVLETVEAEGMGPGSTFTAAILAPRLQLRHWPRRAFVLDRLTAAGVARVEATLLLLAHSGELEELRPGVYRVPDPNTGDGKGVE